MRTLLGSRQVHLIARQEGAQLPPANEPVEESVYMAAISPLPNGSW